MAKQNRKQEILELQNMLRTIASVDPRIPDVNPDGIFGPKTESAVIEFQKLAGLPPSGVVDFVTWDAIFRAYMNASQKRSLRPIQPFPSNTYEIRSGERSDIVMFIQLMLLSLSLALEIFEEIEPNGVYDQKTEDAVIEFQKAHSLPANGIVDYKTWNALADRFATIAENGLYSG